MTNSHGTAGRIAREMAQHRFRKQAIYAAFLFLIAMLIFSNLHKVVKFGLPAVIILAVVVIQVADHLEKKGLHQKKRAKDADRGARAEEVVAGRRISKWDSRWKMGTWLGKTEVSDERLIYASGEASHHRTIRRFAENDPRR